MDKAVLDTQIAEATVAHGAWKAKLRSAISTGVLPKPAKDIACDDQCSFGKWLYSMQGDAEIAGSAHYKKVKDLHAQFHRCAGDVASFVEAGDLAKASASLSDVAYSRCTDQLTVALQDWKRAN